MAFAASRAERPGPVVENCGGGLDLKRHIRQDSHQIPGYTGHVPGRKIEQSGIGRTYGDATNVLLDAGPGPAGNAFPLKTSTDFRTTGNLGIGQYTRPGDDPVDMYATVTSKQLERGSQPIEYAVPPNQTIPGYQGFLPAVRDRIGGPGEQYWQTDKEGSNAREDVRAYGRPWKQNTRPTQPKESIQTAWRPKLENGAQDPWKPEEETLPTGVRYYGEKPRGLEIPPSAKSISNVGLAMGPRTEWPEYPDSRGFQYKPEDPNVVSHGRRQGAPILRADASHAAQTAAQDAERIRQMKYKTTAHDHPGNVVTSLTTTGGAPLRA